MAGRRLFIGLLPVVFLYPMKAEALTKNLYCLDGNITKPIYQINLLDYRFTAQNSGQLAAARFFVTTTQPPIPSYTVNVYKDNSGVPGTLLATSSPATLAGGGWSSFTFATPPSSIPDRFITLS